MKDIQLPIRRIRLYQHGQGYFEHLGQIEGAQTLSLNFQQEEMDDVLRTLSAVDLDGGEIQSITYPARRSLADQLKQLPLRLNPEQPWQDLLQSLQGQLISVEATGFTGTGTMIGLDAEKQEKQTVMRLLLLTESGIRRIPLDTLILIDALDAGIAAELKQWLRLLSSRPDRSLRGLSIVAKGQGPRRLNVSYTRPMPAWRMAYRLYLQADGLARLQGWALLDNATEQDWDAVNVQLLSGQPGKSGILLNTSADRLQAEMKSSPTSPKSEGMFDGGILDDYLDKLYNSHIEHEQLAEADSKSQHFRAAADARQTGHLVEYQLEAPVSLAAGQSALVPVLSAEMPCQRVLSYWLANDKTHWPQSALRFENPVDRVLDLGPVVVHEEEAYAGEADLPVLPPAESCLLEYGEEQRVTIDCDFETSCTQMLTQLKLERGYLQTLWRKRHYTLVCIQSRHEQAVTCILRYPCRFKQHLVEQEGLRYTRQADHYEIEFELEAGSSLSLTLILEEMQGGSLHLSEYPVDLVNQLEPTRFQELIAEFEHILQHQLEVDRLSQAIRARQAQMKQFEQTQETMLKNIQTLGTAEDAQPLRKRWLDILMGMEQDLDLSRKLLDELHAEKVAAQKALEAALTSLSIEQTFTDLSEDDGLFT